MRTLHQLLDSATSGMLQMRILTDDVPSGNKVWVRNGDNALVAGFFVDVGNKDMTTIDEMLANAELFVRARGEILTLLRKVDQLEAELAGLKGDE